MGEIQIPLSSLDLAARAAEQDPAFTPDSPRSFAYILDKHTRILTQCLGQRVLSKVTAGKFEENAG